MSSGDMGIGSSSTLRGDWMKLRNLVSLALFGVAVGVSASASASFQLTNTNGTFTVDEFDWASTGTAWTNNFNTTTGTTFTLFFYSMTAASLAFFNWPAEPVSVLYDSERSLTGRIKSFFSAWDLDGLFRWVPRQPDDQNSLTLLAGERTYSGFRAVRMMLLLNPITYIVIAASIAALGDWSGEVVLYRRLIVVISLVILMPPLAWILDMLTSPSESQAAVAPRSKRQVTS